MPYVIKYAIGATLTIAGLGVLLFIFFAGIMASFIPSWKGVDLGLGSWILLGVVGFAVFVTGKYMTRDNPLPRDPFQP
ncbi:MAG: hypothetical protein HYX90_10005 [Chloroflexi bacterium]|nr:hypothetical protein [Chloroflexota bacterium]